MAKLKVNKVSEIPVLPENNSIYLVKGSGDTKFKLISTTSSGGIVELDAASLEEIQGELRFEFPSPAEEWIVRHDTNRMPDPNIIVDGKKVLSNVEYIDNDTFKIIHSKPYAGVVTFPKG